MMKLNTSNLWTRWFVWCCDNLPGAVGYLPSSDPDAGAVGKKGAWYIEHGTSLCHFVWASWWAPLFYFMAFGVIVMLIVNMHIEAYHKVGVAGLLIPIGILVSGVLLAFTIVLLVVGGDKSGFFGIIGHYLKSVKDRVCPLVRFDDSESK